MEDKIRKCSFEYWYPLLKNNTIKSYIIEMPNDFRNFLLKGDFIIDRGMFPDLSKKIDNIIESLGGSVFPKLNFTAPTDAKKINTGKKLEIKSFEDFAFVMKASTKIIIDLIKPFDVNVEIKPIIVLKKYYKYRMNREFRIFVRDKNHVFISSRYPELPYEFIENEIKLIFNDIIDAVLDKISDKIIIDGYISSKLKPHIIDIQPWNEVSNSLLFSWNELNELNESEVRISKELSIKPVDETVVPVELLDGESLENVIKSIDDFKKISHEMRNREFPDDIEIIDI